MIMRPALRKLALIAHIGSSVGWFGAVIAYLALDITVFVSQNIHFLRAAYIAMGITVSWAIVPLAITSLITGLVVSLGTSWGVFRHYWVIFKLLLTSFATIILLLAAPSINSMATMALNPKMAGTHLSMMGNTLLHSVGGLVVLLVILLLSVYKPKGLTRYGWRKQQEK
ncbi:DUF2269 domain-containing protein [Bacillus salitolerans]|uniref:DUF2269 domain-containing protein n=1 Tax=Bacillus salitolerans TaxID=1437434 RepID=A0ABW4LWM3_9BACI